MATAILSRPRFVRPRAVLTGRLVFSVYMVDAGSNQRQPEPVLITEEYDEAQHFFRCWLHDNLKQPSGMYPLIVVDEAKGGAE